MNVISLVLIFLTAGAALASAHYWRRSSQVVVDPGWTTEPGDAQLSQMGWIGGVLQANLQSGDLNRAAARWAIAAAVMGLASGVLGILA